MSYRLHRYILLPLFFCAFAQGTSTQLATVENEPSLAEVSKSKLNVEITTVKSDIDILDDFITILDRISIVVGLFAFLLYKFAINFDKRPRMSYFFWTLTGICLVASVLFFPYLRYSNKLFVKNPQAMNTFFFNDLATFSITSLVILVSTLLKSGYLLIYQLKFARYMHVGLYRDFFRRNTPYPPRFMDRILLGFILELLCSLIIIMPLLKQNELLFAYDEDRREFFNLLDTLLPSFAIMFFMAGFRSTFLVTKQSTIPFWAAAGLLSFSTLILPMIKRLLAFRDQRHGKGKKAKQKRLKNTSSSFFYIPAE